MLPENIADLLKRPVGRLTYHVHRLYNGLAYKAGYWDKPRRILSKIEWHPGQLFPHGGFLVTNLPSEPVRIFAFYNQRGTAEQHIKEKQDGSQVDPAVNPDDGPDRGSSPIPYSRLQPRHVLAEYRYTRRGCDLVTHEPTDLLDKIGAQVVRHARVTTF